MLANLPGGGDGDGGGVEDDGEGTIEYIQKSVITPTGPFLQYNIVL